MGRIARNQALAWIGVAAWLALVGFLMLSPGEDSLVEDTSRLFGGTEITDALGHVVLFGVLTALLAHALRFQMTAGRAIGLAVAITVTLGTALELAQVVAIERGASLLDLSANWIGPLAMAGWLRWFVFPARLDRKPARAIGRPDSPGSRR